ncbi:MAG: right-handed parallel beta-helix repeat-containing protein, partial [Schleiferiaceae bacterium]|nr:right-handed parallel beta-helix repeat-containing protein [Schleiferiaceae bacterium]
YGCYMYASGGSQTWDVQDNTLNDVGYYGFYISNSSAGKAEKVTVKNNNINMLLNSTFAYGLYLGYVDGAQGRSEVSNNMVNVNMPTTATVYTFYPYALDSADIYFNTFAVQSAAGASGTNTYGIYGGSTGTNSGTKFRNNIFANAVGGPAANFLAAGVTSGMFGNMNYNLYYGTTSNPVIWGATSCGSLAALQTASSQEANGQWGDPSFTSTSDAHVEGLVADGTATPIAGITTDIDGDTRNATTPDIGADEFTPPACAKPSGVNFVTLLPTSAYLTWFGNAGGYELEWGPAGFTPGTGSSASSSTASATITVMPATTYDVYIRSNCVAAGNGYSAWYGPVSFTSPCLVQSMPVTESFTSWTPACWDLSGGTAAWQHYTTGGVTLARAYYWGNNDKSFIMESPLINLTVDAQVKFDWAHWGQYITSYPYDSLSLRVRSTNSATWTTLKTLKGSAFAMATGSTIAPPATLSNEIVFIPSSFTGDTVIVQFYAWSDYGPDLFLDNIVIEEVPACPPPTGLAVLGAGATTATLTYIPSAGNTGYTIEWGPCGYTPGTGTMPSTTTTNDTVTITGLSPNTCYDFYVFANCGSSTGTSPVGPASTTTLCQAASIPYSDDFQNWSTTSPLPCWDIDNGTQTVMLYTDAASNNSMRWYFWAWVGGTTGIATSRPVNISAAATVSFDWSHSNQYWTTYNDQMTLRVRKETSSQWDTLVYLNGQSFNAAGSGISTPGTFENEFLYLDTSYIGHNVIFEFYGNSGFGPDVFIDNFNVDFIPTCPDPVLTTTAITATTASFSWANVVGTTPLGSTIVWGPQGFYNGTGNPGTWVHGVNSPYTITGMSPNTFYDVYVMDSCGGNDFSGMVGPVTIKTDCLAQLSGTYTIDANGTGANNFATLDSAMQFLSGCGISGPVTFNVAAGTYTGSINLATVTGGSSTNTVTINGPATGVAKINASAGQTAATFDGTSYVTLNNLTLSNQMGHVIWMVNGAEYITVNGCKILGDTVGTSSTTGTPIAISALSTSPTSYGLNANHITITNNVVKGGYYGIVVNGASTGSKVQDFTITGNDVSLQYFYNIRTYYAEDLTINDNNCHDTRSTGGYGLMVYYSNDFEIVGNNLPSKTYGLYLYYSNVYNSSGTTGYTPTSQSIVANNMVKGSTYGAYMYSPRYVDFYYNTFAGTTYGAYIGTTTTTGAQMTNNNVKNNIFSASSNYSVYVPTVPLNVLSWDYNLYYTGGANLAYYGSAYSTLAVWKTAVNAINANSVNSQVTFMGADDLHLVTGANNLGTPITGISTDIDGDTRSTTTPDIGADEYTPIADDARIEDILGASGGCGDSTIAIYVAFQNFGLDTITSMSAEVKVTDPNANVTTLTATYAGALAPLDYDTVMVGTINTYAGGTYSFLGYIQLANDGRTNNDTMNFSSYYLPFEPVVTGMVDTVCASQDSVTLAAVAVPGTTYGWFNSLTDTTILAQGDTYTVPTSGQSSYFVQFLNTADSAETPIPGGNGQSGNMFNIINTSGAPLSITGFAQGPGSGNSSVTGAAMIVYYTPGDYTTQSAASWSQIASGTVNLTASATTGYLPVSVTIPAGATYGFYVGLTSGTVQYTNGTGTAGSSPWYVHPKFTITEGLGGSYPNPAFSPRNWNGQVFFGSAGCSDIRAEVSFAINTDTAVAVGSGVETNPATGLFDFDATGSSGHVFNW